jgi:hypothetical protein
MHLYCIDTKIVSKWTETRFHITHPPKSSIGCVQYDFKAYGTFGTNRPPILRLALSPNEVKQASTWASSLGVSFGVSKTISQPMVRLVQTMHLSCTYIAPSLTLSPNGPKQYSTWPTSPRTSILCVQNIFCVYGPFGANSTRILHQDQHHLQTRWNELPLEPCHLGVPSGASKMISEPMVRFSTNHAPILHWY